MLCGRIIRNSFPRVAPVQHTSQELVEQIRGWAHELGFQQLGITNVDLGEHEGYLQKWLDAGYHGGMDYMKRHGSKRSRPEELVPGTCRVLSVRMDYHLGDTDPADVLASSEKAYISRYTLGRDYHKLLRKRLAQLAERIEQAAGLGFPVPVYREAVRHAHEMRDRFSFADIACDSGVLDDLAAREG